jgi:mono/diheme cytochrome c family protein
VCHGLDGKGNGVAAPLLHPRPRDFTTGTFKFRTTASGSIPTDADLLRSIREGLPGTSMPALGEFLRGDSLASVVLYVKSFSSRFLTRRPIPLPPPLPVLSTEASLRAGKAVYERLDCGSCHGSDGTGKDAVAVDLQDDWGYTLRPTNLSEPWTFRGGSDANAIYMRIRGGIDGAPMPSYAASASEKEMLDAANYVVSLARKPVWSMSAEELMEHYRAISAHDRANPVERGRYLARAIGCATCHTSFSGEGYLLEELANAGGMKWSLGPYGFVYSTNLTSDKETGLGGWTDEEIRRGITRGIRKDGSRSIPFPMPWTSLASLSEEDLNAIIAYLRTIPPVYNKIPDPEPLNLVSYLWGKFKMLILRKDFAVMSYPGNAGTTAKGVQR